MDFESCEVFILSHKEPSKKTYFCIRKGDMKTDGWSNFRMALPTILDNPITYPIDVGTTTDLMPINLVKFNTETEMEN